MSEKKWVVYLVRCSELNKYPPAKRNPAFARGYVGQAKKGGKQNDD